MILFMMAASTIIAKPGEEGNIIKVEGNVGKKEVHKRIMPPIG